MEHFDARMEIPIQMYQNCVKSNSTFSHYSFCVLLHKRARDRNYLDKENIKQEKVNKSEWTCWKAAGCFPLPLWLFCLHFSDTCALSRVERSSSRQLSVIDENTQADKHTHTDTRCSLNDTNIGVWAWPVVLSRLHSSLTLDLDVFPPPLSHPFFTLSSFVTLLCLCDELFPLHYIETCHVREKTKRKTIIIPVQKNKN